MANFIPRVNTERTTMEYYYHKKSGTFSLTHNSSAIPSEHWWKCNCSSFENSCTEGKCRHMSHSIVARWKPAIAGSVFLCGCYLMQFQEIRYQVPGKLQIYSQDYLIPAIIFVPVFVYKTCSTQFNYLLCMLTFVLTTLMNIYIEFMIH